MRWRPFKQTRRTVEGMREAHRSYGAVRQALQGRGLAVAAFLRRPSAVLDFEVPVHAEQMPAEPELRLRYANAGRTACLQGGAALLLALASMLAGSVLALLCGVACMAACLALYLNTAFRMWAVRRYWARRGDPQAPRSYRFGAFLDAVAEAPAEGLPRRFPA